MSAPFAADLLAWFDRHRADLPWRTDPPDPYRVWLSEVMLQQTQVETVRGYFLRFVARYPTVHALASAPLDDVLKQWEGLGYYSRARNLHRTAQIIAHERGGVFPAEVDALMELPGIGRYTAGAIASIAYGVRAPVLDGNVIRVFARLIDLPDDVTRSATLAALWAQATDWTPPDRPGDYNQALMELGQAICKPRQPLCADCPIRSPCAAYARGTQAQRPVRARKAPTPHYDVTAGIIRDPRDPARILIAQRPPDGLLGGLWEFPGGKQEPGESLPQCLARELSEELGIQVQVGELFTRVQHAFTHFKITLHVYECLHTGGTPQTLGVHAFAWVTEDDLSAYSFGKADRQVIAEMVRRRGLLL